MDIYRFFLCALYLSPPPPFVSTLLAYLGLCPNLSPLGHLGPADPFLQSTTSCRLFHIGPRLYFYEALLKGLTPVPEQEAAGAAVIVHSLAPPPGLGCRATPSTLYCVAGTASSLS